MAETLNLEICALDRPPLRYDAAEVSVPGTQGLFVVLPGHAPLLSTIELGVIQAVMPGGEQRSIAVSGGFVQVLDNRVLVLSQTAEAGDEIDVERAEAARDRAKKRLEHPNENTDVHRAEIALKRALNRLHAAGHTGGA